MGGVGRIKDDTEGEGALQGRHGGEWRCANHFPRRRKNSAALRDSLELHGGSQEEGYRDLAVVLLLPILMTC